MTYAIKIWLFLHEETEAWLLITATGNIDLAAVN